MSLRCAIIDDEELARLKLERFISEDTDFEVVHILCDGQSALDALREDPVDLVFLDIRMPGLDGFEMLQRLGDDIRPHVIFTTAFDRYALDAFEVHAIDYLLKPFDRRRFITAIHEAKDRLQKPNPLSPDVLAAWPRKDPVQYPKRLAIRDGARIHFVEIEQVIYAEAAGNYLDLHLAERTLLYRQTLTRLETLLDPHRFARIHRSYLINLNYVRELISEDQHRCRVVLENDVTLNVGRSYRAKLTDLLLDDGHVLDG